MLKIETLVVGALRSNCYIVFDGKVKKAIIIDPGDDADFIIRRLSILGLDPEKIVATHGHFDHNMAAFELQSAYKIPYLISESDFFLLKTMPKSANYFLNINSVKIPKPEKFLKRGMKLGIGNSFFKILAVPGHTPGGITLYNQVENIIFTGDTIFAKGAIGRYDFSYSNKKDLVESIDLILSLPKETIIYPGHGKETSVENELEYHT